MGTLTNETLLEMQRRMLRIRAFDERASKMVKRGPVYDPLYSGYRAVYPALAPVFPQLGGAVA